MKTDAKDDMLDFVKSIADGDRLRVIGLLAGGPASTSGISAGLGIPPAALARHLEQLTSLGVVRFQSGLYELDEEALEKFRREKLHQPRQVFNPPEWITEADGLLLRHLVAANGSLKRLPGQRKQWKAVMHYILPVFQVGESYTEKQVNAMLSRFHADTAALRRYLVDDGMLQRQRDGSRYWREG